MITPETTPDQFTRLIASYEIPSRYHGGLYRYLVDRVRPGGFLTAILENNLLYACAHADGREAVCSLKAMAAFLFDQAPAAAYSSEAAVKMWLHGEPPPATIRGGTF